MKGKEAYMKRSPMKIAEVLDVVTPGIAGTVVRNVLPDRPAKLKDAYGKDIICIEGPLWITQTSDYEDHILEPGDHFEPRHHGPVIVSAFTKGSYVLD